MSLSPLPLNWAKPDFDSRPQRRVPAIGNPSDRRRRSIETVYRNAKSAASERLQSRNFSLPSVKSDLEFPLGKSTVIGGFVFCVCVSGRRFADLRLCDRGPAKPFSPQPHCATPLQRHTGIPNLVVRWGFPVASALRSPRSTELTNQARQGIMSRTGLGRCSGDSATRPTKQTTRS